MYRKVNIGNDKGIAQAERKSHSKNRGGKNQQSSTCTKKVQVGNDQEIAQSERKSHSKTKVRKNEIDK